MEKIQYGGEGKRCPVCSKRVQHPGWAYCSLKCRDEGKSKRPIVVYNSEVEELMRQYRAGNWTKVDGW